MSMQVAKIQNYGVNFRADKEPGQKVKKTTDKGSTSDENPISKLGERETLLKATVITGLGVGARALWWLTEEGFTWDSIFNASKKLVDKNKSGLTGTKKSIAYLGAWAALMVGFVAAVAVGYTIYKSPNIMYDGKVNAFKKGKDMDVYVKSNKVEKHLYDQMNDKAKDATAEEKEKLKQQYLKLKAAKNQTPDFVNKAEMPPA